jgi:hypothetical protein
MFHYKLHTLLLLGIGGAPLLIYPFVLFAGIMSLAGHRTGNEPPLLVAFSTAFLVGSIAYPVVYGPCLVAALAMRANEAKQVMAFRISLIPLACLSVLVLLAVGWIWAENAGR